MTDLSTAQGRTGETSERTTRIMQPGSTVATSLCDGEAARKHTMLLEVRGSQFRRTPIPLRCVRPFRLEEVSLKSE
jgi:double-strand break repair protein MRE11